MSGNWKRTLASSVKSNIEEFKTQSGRSLINTRKSRGPSMLPWGIPEITGSSDELQLFIDTYSTAVFYQ